MMAARISSSPNSNAAPFDEHGDVHDGQPVNPVTRIIQEQFQEIQRSLSNPSTRSLSPGAHSVRGDIAAFQKQIHGTPLQRETPSTLSSVGAMLCWPFQAIQQLASSVFFKDSSEQTIQAVLDELKASESITPAQYSAVLEQSQKPVEAFRLLASFLGFAVDELLPLLSHAKAASTNEAFPLLLECHLIRKFASDPSLASIMNESDRACLSTISFDGLAVRDTVKEQLNCLRSLSYRATLLFWVRNLPNLFLASPSASTTTVCIEALKRNDALMFMKGLTPFLTAVSNQPPSTESTYAKELLASFTPKFSLQELAIEVRHEQFLSRWGQRLTSLKKAAEVLVTTSSCSRVGLDALRQAHAILTDESIRSRYIPTRLSLSPTLRATQVGSIARSIRKIESMLKAPGGSEEGALPPKHILHLKCSCGGGHSGMVQALNGSIRVGAALSPYRLTTDELDVPVQVTRSVDPVYNVFRPFGGNVDTTSLYNFLLRHDLCSVISFLRWVSSGDPDKSSAEKKQSLIRQAILSRDPDFLNMVYAFDGIDIDAVSQQLGLPLLYVSTDLDLDDWKHVPTSPYFREAIPTLEVRAIAERLKVERERVEEIGLSVGPEFETQLTTEQLQQVRSQFGIRPDERVVLFSNGGAALQNSIPKQIALGYNDKNVPIHFLVVCGKNTPFKEYLEQSVVPKIPEGSSVRMTVLGFQKREEMAKLVQLADVAIGKPGGMSTMEFVKTGTNVIFDESSFRMPWERFNADVVVHSGHGVVMNRPNQIIDLLKTSLQMGRKPPMDMALIKASEKYVGVVHRLLTEANRPDVAGGWRERRREWHQMNKRMALPWTSI